MVLKHYPIYTIGIRSKEYFAKLEESLKNLGADFYRASSGGSIIVHGPGQLVVYPIISLKNFKLGLKDYVRKLEDCLIGTCSKFLIQGYTNEHVGVWVNEKKIAAIGKTLI